MSDPLEPSQEDIERAARVAGWVPPKDRARARAPLDDEDDPPPSRTRLTPAIVRRGRKPPDQGTPILTERRFTRLTRLDPDEV